jgi:S1-C subfamily serine protease
MQSTRGPGDSEKRCRSGRWAWCGVLCVATSVPLLAQTGSRPSGAAEKDPARRGVGASAVETVTDRIQQDLEKSVAAAPQRPGSQKAPVAEADSKKSKKTESDPKETADDEPAQGADAKRTVKPVTPPAPAGKGRVKAVEVDAQQSREATESVLLYRIFMSAAETTAEEKKQAQARFEFWEQVAKDDLVRVGKQWMPRPDAERLKGEADKLVAEAIELIKLENFAKADTKLERASKIFPDHLESLFLLGLGALLTDDVKGAEKRFSQCLARAPNHVPLLNNAALSAALSKKYDRAVKLWEKAAAVDPENPAIAQNLGQFIADAAKGKSLAKAARTKAEADAARGRVTGKIQIDFANVDKRVVSDAQEIYARLVASGKVPRSDPARGYTILKLFQEKKGGSDDRSSPEESQVVGNGSGFVIWDGFVMTNRHVVENADAVVIQDPANPSGEPLGGTVVAVSKELDLAIVECKPLKAPAVPILSAEVSRGTEVLALGFPVMSVVGKGLKATRGIVTGLPSKDTGNLMVLDVQINPGNSGGPLCDKSGRVMGIVAAKTFTERFVQGYGLAIPMSDAVPFVKKTIPAFSEPGASDKKLEWTEVDAGISKSTVLVLIKKKKKS